MGYTRKPYGREGYGRYPYMRSPYGLSQDVADPSLLFYAPLLTSLDEVNGTIPTFTRASIGTYIGSDGLLKTAVSGEPRFEYDTGGGARGYLSEGERENLLVWSEEFDNAAWTKTAVTITPDDAVAPDGASSGDRLQEDGSNSPHRVFDTAPITSGDTTTVTAFARAGERTEFGIWSLASGGNGATAVFDLLDGTVVSAASAGLGTLVAASIELAPNGWWRCSVTATHGASTSAIPEFRLALNGSTSYQGDGTSGLYLWGAQLETASFASSYIPTQASAVTRAADRLFYPLSGLNGSGSISVNYAPTFASQDLAHVYQVDDGTTANRYLLRHGSGGNTEGIRYRIVSGGAPQADQQTSADDFESNVSKAITLTAETAASKLYTSGVQRLEQLSITLPLGITTLNVGTRDAGVEGVFGHITTVKIYNRVLGAGEV